MTQLNRGSLRSAPVAGNKDVSSAPMIIVGWDPNGTVAGRNDIVSAYPDVTMSVPSVESGSPDIAWTR